MKKSIFWNAALAAVLVATSAWGTASILGIPESILRFRKKKLGIQRP